MNRYDKDFMAMSEGVLVVEKELEEQQEVCQTLQAQLNQLEMETSQSQMNKTQVNDSTLMMSKLSYGLLAPGYGCIILRPGQIQAVSGSQGWKVPTGGQVQGKPGG